MSAESDFYCLKCGYEWCAIPPSNCPVCHRRKTKLRECLLNLAAWATTRANGEHDTQTTLRKTESANAGSLHPVVRRQRRCQWMTDLKDWNDCGEVATHVRLDCGLCYCRLHAKVLMPYAHLEPLPLNAESSQPAQTTRPG